MSDSRESEYYVRRWKSFNIQAKINRINKLLACNKQEIGKAFQWDEESLWSFTHHNISIEIANKLLTMPGITKDSIVTDAMSSIGGITIPFAQVFKHVNAIELNKDRCNMLSHNVGLYELENVDIMNGYYQDFIDELEQDIIYFDPPWGIDYRRHKYVTLQVLGPDGPVNLEDAICDLKGRTRYALVKVPISYDMDYFMDGINGACRIISKKDYAKPNSMRAVLLRY